MKMALGSSNASSSYTGIGYPFSLKSISAAAGVDFVTLTWSDPDDAGWLGTRIVRNEKRYPAAPNDGKIVVDTRERDAFSESGFVDEDIELGKVYYYQAFPYSLYGYNICSENRPSPVIEFLFTYSGNLSKQEISVDGRNSFVFALTSSGTITAHAENIMCDVWMCGGGANGKASTTGAGNGGGGAFATEAQGVLLETGPIVIGAGNGGSTSAFGLSANGTTGASGGSGGGSSGLTPGSGDGKSKIPFGLTQMYRHCGGGGGGGYYGRNTGGGDVSGTTYGGGNGGSNGGGGSNYNPNASSPTGGSGGIRGGGNGGSSTSAGGSATFYGSGGGGGGLTYGNSEYTTYSGGSGYQGVVYIMLRGM